MSVPFAERDQLTRVDQRDTPLLGDSTPIFSEVDIGSRFPIPDNFRRFFPELDQESTVFEKDNFGKSDDTDSVQAPPFSTSLRVFSRDPSDEFADDTGVFGNAAVEDSWNSPSS